MSQRRSVKALFCLFGDLLVMLTQRKHRPGKASGSRLLKGMIRYANETKLVPGICFSFFVHFQLKKMKVETGIAI